MMTTLNPERGYFGHWALTWQKVNLLPIILLMAIYFIGTSSMSVWENKILEQQYVVRDVAAVSFGQIKSFTAAQKQTPLEQMMNMLKKGQCPYQIISYLGISLALLIIAGLILTNFWLRGLYHGVFRQTVFPRITWSEIKKWSYVTIGIFCAIIFISLILFVVLVLGCLPGLLLAYYSALLKIIYFIPYTLIAGGAAFYIFSIIYLENSLNGVLDATDGRSKTLTALKPIGGHLSLFWCFLGGIIIEIFLLFPLMLPRNILQFMAPRPSVAVVIVSSIFMALIYGLQLSWNLGLGHKIGTRYALLQEQLASLPPEGPAAKFK